MADSTFKVYNVDEVGVNVDIDDLHGAPGGFRHAQNISRDPIGRSGSIVTRPGLIGFNSVAMSGTVLGGVVIPAFDLSGGVLTLFVGMGE